MRSAPRNAVFVWCRNDTRYPEELARYLGRDDLRIVGPGVSDNFFRALKVPVVIDHACLDRVRDELHYIAEVVNSRVS